MKQSTKGILKKHQIEHEEDKKELHWDETAIQQQDLERGNYAKIPEPKTPYEESIQVEEDEPHVEPDANIEQELQQAEYNKHILQQQANGQNKLNIEELNKKLKVDLERERKDMDHDSEEDEKKRIKHEEFLKKRKSHYNEAKNHKMALAEHEPQEQQQQQQFEV